MGPGLNWPKNQKGTGPLEKGTHYDKVNNCSSNINCNNACIYIHPF